MVLWNSASAFTENLEDFCHLLTEIGFDGLVVSLLVGVAIQNGKWVGIGNWHGRGWSNCA